MSCYPNRPELCYHYHWKLTFEIVQRIRCLLQSAETIRKSTDRNGRVRNISIQPCQAQRWARPGVGQHRRAVFTMQAHVRKRQIDGNIGYRSCDPTKSGSQLLRRLFHQRKLRTEETSTPARLVYTIGQTRRTRTSSSTELVLGRNG